MLSSLNHPNIIKLYSTFQDKRKLYFILEYCPNRDLSEFVRCQGKDIHYIRYITV
jgi:serine/threonine protein kinase